VWHIPSLSSQYHNRVGLRDAELCDDGVGLTALNAAESGGGAKYAAKTGDVLAVVVEEGNRGKEVDVAKGGGDGNRADADADAVGVNHGLAAGAVLADNWADPKNGLVVLVIFCSEKGLAAVVTEEEPENGLAVADSPNNGFADAVRLVEDDIGADAGRLKYGLAEAENGAVEALLGPMP
jgi:hypothetical protein